MSNSRPEQHTGLPWAGAPWPGLRRRWQAGMHLALRGRYLLWSMLVLLLAALLSLLVWLTGRYEDSAVQDRLEFATSAIVTDLRGALARNLLRLQALPHRQHWLWSEQEVMRCVVDGLANKEVADTLGISVRTVEVHRARFFEKMGVRSAVELATLLHKTGRP